MPGSTEDATDAVERREEGALIDEQIVARVLTGDVAAFELIMRRYNQRLFRVVRSILADDYEVEDVIQETYLRAFERLSQFAGLASFSTWLTKIAVYEALARRKRRERLQIVDFEYPGNLGMAPLTPGAGAEQAASDKELGEVLTKAVDALPDDLRTVFALRMIEGLDTRESANCLDLTEANVKVRLHRARALLRDRIDAQLGVEVRRLYQFGGERCDRIVRAVMSRLSAS